MTPREEELATLLREVVHYVADSYYVFGSTLHWDRQDLLRRIRLAVTQKEGR